MNGRRPLGELLGELADVAGLLGQAGRGGVVAHSLDMRLPIDIRMGAGTKGHELFGDVPMFITRTAFDPEPAMLVVHWRAVPAEDVAS